MSRDANYNMGYNSGYACGLRHGINRVCCVVGVVKEQYASGVETELKKGAVSACDKILARLASRSEEKKPKEGEHVRTV